MKYTQWYVAMALAAYAMNAEAISPEPLPSSLIAEIDGAEIFYKGRCIVDNQDQLCIMANQPDKSWILYYTKEGVLYKVSSFKEGVETVRWLHSQRGA
jgi:hypothetical protein